jgi:hypothetical protein
MPEGIAQSGFSRNSLSPTYVFKLISSHSPTCSLPQTMLLNFLICKAHSCPRAFALAAPGKLSPPPRNMLSSFLFIVHFMSLLQRGPSWSPCPKNHSLPSSLSSLFTALL